MTLALSQQPIELGGTVVVHMPGGDISLTPTSGVQLKLEAGRVVHRRFGPSRVS